ncbi:MAG: autotransporter domain-containing protein [Candidatus Omnitrophica bacterium]|nr:autotransporter domain-containing protein [Candidatus Omnitrophota bacterium]
MKKICYLIISLTITLSGNLAKAEEWNFAVTGDTRATGGGDPTGVNTTAVTAITNDIVNNRDCEFVLFVGDYVYGEDAGWPTLESQFQTFKDTVSNRGLSLVGSGEAGLTYYPVRGNHELDNSETGIDTEALWRNKFSTLPQNGPTTASGGGGNSEVGMTYSFEYNNAFILAIDQYINADQTNQEWVDQQLITSSGHIIAFGHEPAYQANHVDCLAGDQASRDAFLTSLRNAGDYGGKLYFCGHDHFIALGRVYEKNPALGGSQDFYQLIIGSGGAPSHNFDGVYNSGYADYEVSDLYHDSDPGASIPYHYGYGVVTIDDESLWLKLYGTENLTPVDWQVLHTLVINGTLQGNTTTLTSGITNDATLEFNQTIDGAYTNQIDGTGDVVKSGKGKLTFTADNDYTGATIINEGTLNILGNNSNTAATVQPAGILAGTGTIKSILNSGTIKPGNSIGTLNLNGGSFSQSSSGILELEISSLLNFDKIIGASTAGLNGTLKTITSGNYSPGDTLNGVIQTAGGITGSFTDLQTQITPTIIWQPDIDGNDLDLVATRDYNNATLKASLAPNEQKVAAIMQKILPTAAGDLATVKTAIDALATNAAVKNAYAQISPEKLNSISTISLNNAALGFTSLGNQMETIRSGLSRGVSYNSRSGLFAGDIYNGVLLAYEGDDWAKFLPRSDPKAQEAGNLGLFINANGGLGDQESTNAQAGFNYTTAGLTAGLDYRLTDKTLVGLYSGYNRTKSMLDGSNGKVYVDSIPFGGYGIYYNDDFYFHTAISYTANLYDTRRNINFGGLQRGAKADTLGHQLSLFLETGNDFEIKNLDLGPKLTLQYSRLWIDSFTETGAGALNIRFPDQTSESLQLGLGIQAKHIMNISDKTVIPRLHASFQHEFLNNSRTIDANLGPGRGIFQITTDEPDRNFALLGCGLTMELTEAVSINLDYETRLGQEDYSANSLSGELHISF